MDCGLEVHMLLGDNTRDNVGGVVDSPVSL